MGMEKGTGPEHAGGRTGQEAPLTPEKRAALRALSYDAALAALDAEDPAALALATEYITACSEQVGELLKQGRDYLELLTPLPDGAAIERIAMELVLETVEDELAGEDP